MVEQRQPPVALNRPMMRPKGIGQTAGTDALFTPKDIVGILRRHVLLIVFSTILGFLVGGVGWYLMMKYNPKYTAKTFIKVLSIRETDPTKIGGAAINKDIQYGYRASLAALIKEQSNLQKLIGRDKIQETKWFQSFGKNKSKRIAKAVKDLKKHLGAGAQRDGEFIIMSMTCGNDKESALIVNEMVDLFIASQSITKKGEVTAKLAALRSQMDSTQTELLYAKKMLDQIRKTTGFTDLEQRYGRDPFTAKLQDLEILQNESVQHIKQIQESIKIVEEQLTEPINEQIENQLEQDPIMRGLTQQLINMEANLAGKLVKFGENHRVVRQLQEVINETKIKKQIRKVKIAKQMRRANLMNLRDELTIFQASLEELEQLKMETEAKKKDLDLAKVRYQNQSDLKDEILERLNGLKEQIAKRTIMHEDPETPKVQKVGNAPVPLEVSSPLWYVYFPGGTMLGMMIGVGIAFLIELLNDLVRTPRDIGRYLHIPLLGIIPDASEDGQVKDLDLLHVVRQAPYSITSESYRRFRNNFKLSGSVESSKVFLISSCLAGDGKTSSAINLSTTLVAENKKVLLIDTNFWRPSLHGTFSKPEDLENNAEKEQEQSESGLSTLLSGLNTFQEVVKSTGIEGFDIIESGQLPSNPSELLCGSQMEHLLKQQRSEYDYIIVDGPPVLLVSDVKSLARLVDGTILVFNANKTRRGIALRTIRELREVNTVIVGCVLFAVKAMKGGYFQEQFKYYEEFHKPQLARSI